MHGRGKMGAAPAFDAAVLRLSFFIFIIFYYYIQICADLASIRADLGRFSQNRVVLAELNCIGQRPKLTETAETGQNQP